MTTVFPAQPTPLVDVAGTDDKFPVNRIYCVGLNYTDHIVEFGADPDKIDPVFFMKPADAVVADRAPVPYPSHTKNFHYEIELVVAIDREASNVSVDDAEDYVFGYAVGNDLTRRDMQFELKEKGMPWDPSKGFDMSAPISAIHRVSDIGHPTEGRIWLSVNGDVKQDGNINQMIAKVNQIISKLSELYVLKPGDLIYTGTPSGIGPVVPGDIMEAGIDGIDTLTTKII
ncbi:MAG: fumarylacetoacetate hydrolase family protein [Kordiimonadaceae bacterium]|jgi:fumarylpyruvate hydrolase|nr:fumarylacetoacetate hydrolase family protein [Kordiimonadaceae bacterium]MBT6036498.1 fumarylacetoacetate hydrolase family protein [Kordiimonadaceae bacterium]MBT6330999.1 fumarylacetoacetate hydrolase family protein [Kordiimonadaceae bacterium]MBT7581448.1 fumarylacetoacetate hydrolase family protein [Kordiimonadaceae bacterium]